MLYAHENVAHGYYNEWHEVGGKRRKGILSSLTLGTFSGGALADPSSRLLACLGSQSQHLFYPLAFLTVTKSGLELGIRPTMMMMKALVTVRLKYVHIHECSSRAFPLHLDNAPRLRHTTCVSESGDHLLRLSPDILSFLYLPPR